MGQPVKQRGFTLLAYLIAGGVVLAMLGGIAWKIHHSGYVEGKAEVQLAWDAANAKAQVEANRLRTDREAEGRKATIALQQAEKEARIYAERWKQAKNALRGTPLAVCPTSSPDGPDAATATDASRNGGPLLTFGFLRQYDGAWTGDDGQPVFGDPSRIAETAPAASAASARGLAEVLDNQQANASRCDDTRRQLGKLITLIERLRAQ